MNWVMLWLAAESIPAKLPPTLLVVPEFTLSAGEAADAGTESCFVRVTYGIGGGASSAMALSCAAGVAPRAIEAALRSTIEVLPTTERMSLTLRFDPAEGQVRGSALGVDAARSARLKSNRVIKPSFPSVSDLPRGVDLRCTVHGVVLASGRMIGAQADELCHPKMVEASVQAALAQRYHPALNAAGEPIDSSYMIVYNTQAR